MTNGERLINSPEEAIECIEKNRPTSGYQMLNESLDMAIAALEKQVPIKPEKNKFGHNCCPSCGYCGIYKDEWGGRYIPHCENCGQAIDWTEVTE